MHKIKNLILKSGVILFVFRLPLRVYYKVLNKLNTLWWSFFVKEIGKNCLIEFGVKIENPKQILIGNNVYIGSGTVFGSENNIGVCKLSDNVHIGKNCKVDHTGNVTIKENTLFSEEVTVFSHSHGYDPRSEAIPMDLCIEENVWVGYRVVILESCSVICSGVIVAACGLVSKDLEKINFIYAGVPVKKIKYKS